MKAVLFMMLGLYAASATAAEFVSAPSGTVVSITGVSTVHRWRAATATVDGRLEKASDGSMAAIAIKIPITSLKSGEGGMEKTMYQGLKADQFPDITYQLKKATLKGGDVYLTEGELTAAGVTKPLGMDMTVAATGNGGLKVSGKTTLRMTDFGIKPPTAMLGIIKSADEVDVSFEWVTKPGSP